VSVNLDRVFAIVVALHSYPCERDQSYPGYHMSRQAVAGHDLIPKRREPAVPPVAGASACA